MLADGMASTVDCRLSRGRYSSCPWVHHLLEARSDIEIELEGNVFSEYSLKRI